MNRHKAGGIVDRRFGEDNPHLTPEEKALERFTRERQRRSRFDLEDDNSLTHYGMTLTLGDDEAPVIGDSGWGGGTKVVRDEEREEEPEEDEVGCLHLLFHCCLDYAHERPR
jgi:nucleolar protein 14